jgi:hypothetical protein
MNRMPLTPSELVSAHFKREQQVMDAVRKNMGRIVLA